MNRAELEAALEILDAVVRGDGHDDGWMRAEDLIFRTAVPVAALLPSIDVLKRGGYIETGLGIYDDDGDGACLRIRRIGNSHPVWQHEDWARTVWLRGVDAIEKSSSVPKT